MNSTGDWGNINDSRDTTFKNTNYTMYSIEGGKCRPCYPKGNYGEPRKPNQSGTDCVSCNDGSRISNDCLMAQYVNGKFGYNSGRIRDPRRSYLPMELNTQSLGVDEWNESVQNGSTAIYYTNLQIQYH